MCEIEKRIQGEKAVIRAICEAAIARGFTVSYNDGGDYPVRKSRDVSAIMAETHSTDEAALVIRSETDRRVGAFYLAYGNAPSELIFDQVSQHYSFDDVMDSLFQAGADAISGAAMS